MLINFQFDKRNSRVVVQDAANTAMNFVAANTCQECSNESDKDVNLTTAAGPNNTNAKGDINPQSRK